MRTALLFLTLTALAGCGGTTPTTPPKERLARVEVMTPVVETLTIRVEAAAVVEPLQKVDVCSRVNGVVAEFFPPNLDIGQRVSAGAPIVRLDVPEIEAQREQRKAALEQAKNQVKQAVEAERVAEREIAEAELLVKRHAADVKFRQLETKRVTELAAKGATQPERVEEAERQLESASAAHDAARGAVETKKAKLGAVKADMATAESRVAVVAADLKTSEEMLALATVKAPVVESSTPFQYVVSRRFVDRGATVKDAAQPLLTLVHLDTVRVLVDVSQRDVPMLEAVIREAKKGSPQQDQVILTVPALRESPSRGEYRGRIARTAGVLDPVTRTMRVEVEFENRNGDLRPGMYGTVSVSLGTRPDALMLPSSAFVRRDGRTEVLVVETPADNPQRGIIRVVPVVVGYDDGKRVQVTAGLTGKERVVVRGNTPVSTGDPVTPVEPRPR